MNNENVSKQWNKINKELFDENLVVNMDSFKDSNYFYKLAMWKPETNGVRYYKSFLYFVCSTLDEGHWEILNKVRNREIGGSNHMIEYNNLKICLDYVQAALEYSFISSKFDFCSKRILEIGAGYGRTAHTIIQNSDITSYTIVDLPECLHLSQTYLKSVLNATEFTKLSFLSASEFKKSEMSFDLVINIDSMAEMDKSIVEEYLIKIGKNSLYFYAKNPVGKYQDPSLLNKNVDKEAIAFALKTGPLNQIVDIFSAEDIGKQEQLFLNAYKPKGDWEAIISAWASPWSYYWNVLYQKVN
ncbi:MAG: hypothetical protein A2381_01125 [Bdellovibrionales bacterium RIFOXYB1_FULL_37_110]|nr:MAG: hypothetical protein A2417_01980 [Bdellovibrionales bacterium RIFOXYC1_FULL_37_79]OFZ58820.1 MAG: hypothetical protein A2381_01125 [Bdellovibrionales bacterium RIFOXYB1_FULL_37_110]OFZ64819.1 MAG: hypothetical protein A2577_07125 [Bdellovibrionales bacterium RIFOXYD1_FULL_36_51]